VFWLTDVPLAELIINFPDETETKIQLTHDYLKNSKHNTNACINANYDDRTRTRFNSTRITSLSSISSYNSSSSRTLARTWERNSCTTGRDREMGFESMCTWHGSREGELNSTITA
jgi:hypothetical protein